MEAASGLMNLVMFPMWILSGVFFSAIALPGDHSTGGAGSAAHRGYRSHARQYAAGHEPRATDNADSNIAGVAGRSLCHRAAHLSLEIAV
jgi:hypothetical protein